MMVSVKFESVTKILGQSRAVDNLSLDIGAGELFFLLGPSGCGKTTALRTVAGFYTPDEGRILLMGKIRAECRLTNATPGWFFKTMRCGRIWTCGVTSLTDLKCAVYHKSTKISGSGTRLKSSTCRPTPSACPISFQAGSNNESLSLVPLSLSGTSSY